MNPNHSPLHYITAVTYCFCEQCRLNGGVKPRWNMWFRGAAKVAQPSCGFGQTWELLRLLCVQLMSLAAAYAVLLCGIAGPKGQLRPCPWMRSAHSRSTSVRVCVQTWAQTSMVQCPRAPKSLGHFKRPFLVIGELVCALGRAVEDQGSHVVTLTCSACV